MSLGPPNVTGAGSEFDLPMEPVPPASPAAAADEPPPFDIEKGLGELAALVRDSPKKLMDSLVPDTPATPATPDPAIAAAAAAEAARIDDIMDTLADVPEETRAAIRLALEQGAETKAAIERLTSTQAHREQEAANIKAAEALVTELEAFAPTVPGATEAQMKDMLLYISKLPEELASTTTLQQAFIGANGLDAYAGASKSKEAAPPAGSKQPSAPRVTDPPAASLVGDGSPGGGQPEAFPVVARNDFSDIAAWVTARDGANLGRHV